jgi:hypothetical protein
MLALVAVEPSPVRAQTAVDPNEGLRLSADAATGALELAWWGRAGRVYFIEHSENLHVWQTLPTFEVGADAPLTYGLSGNAARLFTRVRWVDATLDQFQTGDYDADGLNNAAEASAGLNPFARDTDRDGLPDGWELAYGLNPLLVDSLADFDGDGVLNQEDARPANAVVGRLHIAIQDPIQGSAL